MDSKPAITGVKKRQQIQQANRIVFIWVAIAAVAITVALVLAQFMMKQFFFNTKVISAQVKTNDTLVKNLDVYEPLKTDVSKLVANSDLARLRVQDTDSALQVVIDAMPTADEPIALIASLQQVVLAKSGASISDVTLLQAAPSDTGEVVVATAGVQPVSFMIKANGSYDSIKKLMQDMHNSIRPISVTALKVTGSNANMAVEITANTFYAIPRTVDMTKETINP
jgi:hypothetical protein